MMVKTGSDFSGDDRDYGGVSGVGIVVIEVR